MRGYEANNCRLCEKAFCCENCRIKHETNVHNIFPSCDICVYGVFSYGNIDDLLLKHLETTHLPLYCNYCTKIFKCVEDILQHRKCSVLPFKEDSPKTPFADIPSLQVEDNQSPILQEFQGKEHLKYVFNLATSTPMQKGNEINSFEKSREPLTPVDLCSMIKNKSIIKKTDSIKSQHSSKRRVTFGQTPKHNSEETKSGLISGSPNTSSNQSHFIPIDSSAKHIQLENAEQLDNSQDILTPSIVNAKSDLFYSAKSEQFVSVEGSSKINNKQSQNTKLEGFTPVAIRNSQKMVKGQISKEFNNEISPEISNNGTYTKGENNLNEMSMVLCTPEVSKTRGSIRKHPEKDMSPIIENTKEITDVYSEEDIHKKHNADNHKKACIVLSTPDSQQDIYETEQQHADNLKGTSMGLCKPLSDKNVYETEEQHETMWLSATNLEQTSNLSGQTDQKNKSELNLEKENNVNMQSPSRQTNRRVSIVMPSPIIKRTNLQMNFQFPAHLSSTPIVANSEVKIRHTKIVEEISTKVLSCQTPFKTPQGKLFQIVQRKMGESSKLGRNFAALPMIESTSTNEIDNFSTSTNLDHHESQEDDISNIKPHTESQISVSSMTESSLWTSMTNIVKSVFGGFKNSSQQDLHQSNSASFKRQHSDSDSNEVLEEPRLKRFKFSDIKCRKPIRQLSGNEIAPRVSATQSGLATFKIVKSVSTLYGCERIRIQCDKATQTDDYLMYGWYPKV
ncbi:uncharacterized protein LOC115876740 [Sitophilus oryzae]|uniref:Uncharacterized protein LOC115876740 n=1 Tax=Sitophilus oryzae TaxID=7048 RepID=A0A6J2XC19_SITOR|nr:uncharacterized protein LOC115876740 [Sitophilus oryzae]XP_030748505.1 uncharacterized protein LOC115876740 [Sitophilus oryzae]